MHQAIKLKSKQNQVYRIRDGEHQFIQKTFAKRVQMERELVFLDLLNQGGCKVPRVLKTFDCSICLEDLGQVTLLDWMEDLEAKNTFAYEGVLIELAQWMKQFYDLSYAYFGIPMGLNDIHFRNFLIYNHEFYGIDFEDAKEGSMESDIGKLAVYALSYDPAYTPWKKQFVQDLLETLMTNLHGDQKFVEQEMKKEEMRMAERRK